MPPQDPTPSQEPKDSLPPSSPEWKVASALLIEVSSEDYALRSLRFQKLFQTLRPWMEKAVNSLCRRHVLLLDSSATSFCLVQALVHASELSLRRSASSEVLLQIYLESTALKACKAEQASLSKLGADTGTWDQFRNQFHQLEREERKAVLKSLPQITVAQDKDATPTIPDQNWLTLWSRVTHNIEYDALPLEWQRYLEAPPTSVYAGAEGGPILWVPSKNSDFEQELGHELFKAYGWAAKESANHLDISLPKWLGNPSPESSAHSLSTLIHKNGGLPNDKYLRSIIQSLLTAPQSTKECPDVMALLKACSELGFSKFSVSLHQSAFLSDRNDFSEAEMAIKRALNHSQSNSNVSNALASLASYSILKGDFDRADSLLLEALRLSPWSPIVLGNISYLRRVVDQPQSNEENRNHG